MKINEMLMLDRNLLKNHLYSTFVLPQTTEQKDIIHAIEAEVLHELIIIIKIRTHKTVIVLHPETDSVMTIILLLHNTLGQYMTIINNYSRCYRSPYRSSYRSPYRHYSRHRYRSRSYSRDNNNFTRYTSSYRPPSRPRDFRYSRSR